MKARLNLLSLLFLILLSLTGCQDAANKSFTDSITVYETWSDFQKQKDAASCKKFIDSIENFEPEKLNSYPILKSQTKNQMKICLETAQFILEILEDSEAQDEMVVSEKIEQIDLCLLSYLRNQNFALQDTQQKYFSFFIWLLATIIIGGLILIYLNIREIKKKDQIIYNSEQFLKHSMEVQEAERRRISRELHDVAFPESFTTQLPRACAMFLFWLRDFWTKMLLQKSSQPRMKISKASVSFAITLPRPVFLQTIWLAHLSFWDKRFLILRSRIFSFVL